MFNKRQILSLLLLLAFHSQLCPCRLACRVGGRAGIALSHYLLPSHQVVGVLSRKIEGSMAAQIRGKCEGLVGHPSGGSWTCPGERSSVSVRGCSSTRAGVVMCLGGRDRVASVVRAPGLWMSVSGWVCVLAGWCLWDRGNVSGTGPVSWVWDLCSQRGPGAQETSLSV